nr:MAG TPA: hypothetical protein [Caudoviricetes sp.]
MTSVRQWRYSGSISTAGTSVLVTRSGEFPRGVGIATTEPTRTGKSVR